MGTTRDFISSTLVDAMLPAIRRPVEDIVYETLDRRQVPSQNDFKEVRQLLHQLGDETDTRKRAVEQLSHHIDRIERRFQELEDVTRLAHALASRLSKLEATSLSVAQLDARLQNFSQTLPQPGITPAQLDARLADLEQRLTGQPTVTTDQLDARLESLAQNITQNLPNTAVTPEVLEARLAALAQKIPQLEVRRADLESLEAKIPQSLITPEALEQRLQNLAKALHAAEEADQAAVQAEPYVCKVPGCNNPARARGFCARHYQRWRRGTLKGAYVSIDGDVDVNGTIRRVDPELAGEPYTINGEAILINNAPIQPIS